jgi:hypothetical protein
MKKLLLSLSLFLSISSAFAQITFIPDFNTDPRRPCPIEIKSNQGAGSCGPCGANPNDPAFFAANPGIRATAQVTLIFAQEPACTPRLLAIRDKENTVRLIRCGTASFAGQRGGAYIVEFCIYGENNDNFFNQPDLVAVLSYPCTSTGAPLNPPYVIGCRSNGQQVIIPEEIPLPVRFSSFTAGRSGNTVNLRWSTASEDNNKGFQVQRNSGRGWENVTFINSKADGGNSSANLNYEFNDNNASKVVTQYRLMQVDNDGRSKMSDIRIVRGDAQESRVMVFPNPSKDGNVNILFDDARGNRDVTVMDMNGRVVKQYRSVTAANLKVDNLMPGVYSIRIINAADGSQRTEKVVVSK